MQNQRKYNSLLFLAEDNIKVINGSWGSVYYNTQTHQRIVDQIKEFGTTNLVFAAGNGSYSAQGGNTYSSSSPYTVTSKHYPAGLDHVISVSTVHHDSSEGIIDSHYEKDTYKGHNLTHTHNYSVDIVAPGYDIASVTQNSTNNNSYSTIDGTSMSAPMVSGTLGLMLSANYSLSPKERETILKLSAKNVDYIIHAHNPIHNDSLSDYAIENRPYKDLLGAGRLDVGKAVEMAYRMQQATDTLKINGRDFYRDWEFEIKNAPYAIEIENETFRDTLKVDFTAREVIILKAGTFLSPQNYANGKSGAISLKIDGSIPLASLPPTETSAVLSSTLETQESPMISEIAANTVISPNPFVNTIGITLGSATWIGTTFIIQNTQSTTVLNEVLSQTTTLFDTSSIPAATYYAIIYLNGIVVKSSIITKN